MSAVEDTVGAIVKTVGILGKKGSGNFVSSEGKMVEGEKEMI
jgi:hypothetical protein